METQETPFHTRLRERQEELASLLGSLYGPDRAILTNLVERMATAWLKRSQNLKKLDEKRKEDPDWFLSRTMVGMTMYTHLFAGNLRQLEKRIPYLEEIGITYLHLMPILKKPQGENDGGYAVDDYGTIDPAFGTNEDFIHLTETLHHHGIALCLDFVLNHTSSTHAWAQRAKQGEKKYQQRYQCYSDRTWPDQYEKHVPEVFPSTAPGNFVFCGEMKKWVLSSFYPFQWDLNYHNPVVLIEMVSAMLHLANMGVDVFRLDALPYIWKELGTPSRNLPQVHTIARIFRLASEIVCPGIILKGEVVMAPREIASYFGTRTKPECHLLYGVSSMVNLWSSLASQDVRLLRRQTETLLSLPPHCRFLNYLRCHDDIGWGLDEEEERALHIDPKKHKIFLYRFFKGEYPASYARGELYNFDPQTLDARSCGTTASLVGFESAETKEDKERAFLRFKLLYGTLFALSGVPMIASGDEIGQLNDYTFKQDPLRRDDSRNVHRIPFDHKKAKRRSEAGTVQKRIWDTLLELRSVRAGQITFDADAYVSTWDAHNNHVFALKREKNGKTLLCVSNFSDETEHVSFTYFTGTYRDIFTKREVVPGWGFEMGPHEILWLEQ